MCSTIDIQYVIDHFKQCTAISKPYFPQRSESLLLYPGGTLVGVFCCMLSIWADIYVFCAWSCSSGNQHSENSHEGISGERRCILLENDDWSHLIACESVKCCHSNCSTGWVRLACALSRQNVMSWRHLRCWSCGVKEFLRIFWYLWPVTEEVQTPFTVIS